MQKPIKQDVIYEDVQGLKDSLEKLQKLPPLVTPQEVCRFFTLKLGVRSYPDLNYRSSISRKISEMSHWAKHSFCKVVCYTKHPRSEIYWTNDAS
jgi:hypothetical protein